VGEREQANQENVTKNAEQWDELNKDDDKWKKKSVYD